MFAGVRVGCLQGACRVEGESIDTPQAPVKHNNPMATPCGAWQQCNGTLTDHLTDPLDGAVVPTRCMRWERYVSRLKGYLLAVSKHS